MKPDTESSDQVVARVVAWHNRHPLATRISADQVHSVGVVSLPFAVRGAQVQALPVLPAATADAAPAETAPPVHEAGDDAARTILDRALDAEPPTVEADAAEAEAAAPESEAEADDVPPGPVSRVQWQVSGLPPRPQRRPWLARWRRLRKSDAYRALFSEDFIAPLRQARVAHWAALHGQASWPLQPGAAQRMVMLDPALRQVGDAAPELDLHLITAAIRIGDARLRVLLAPGEHGAVLGQRQWSRQRLLMSAPLALGLMVALGSGLYASRQGAADGAAHPVLAASAPASAVHAVRAASAPASAVHVVLAASAPASAVVAAASSPAADPPASEHSPGPALAAAEPEPEEVILPPSVEPRRGRVDLPPLVPELADAQRRSLRQDAQALRQEPKHQAKAWALVTATLIDKRQSQRVAAQLHAVALLQPVPMRAELLPSGAGWRAVFWPFSSEGDAEKVRLALADKGLRTEVLEF